MAVEPAVALVEGAVADAGELDVGGHVAVGEVGVAVAELLGEVEREPSGELGGAGDGVAVVGETLGGLGGRAQAASRLPRRSGSQPSSEVLLRTATSTSWSACAAGWWAWTSPVATVATPSVVGELAQAGVAARVAALVGALELDEEVLAAERCATRAAAFGLRTASPWRAQPERQTSPSVCSSRVSSGSDGGIGRGRRSRRSPHASRSAAGCRVRGGEQPTEVGVAAGAVSTSRVTWAPPSSVSSAPVIGAEAEELGGVGELERAADAVVIGERERLVAELGGQRGELLGPGGAVEERVRRVAVELDVAPAGLGPRKGGCPGRSTWRRRKHEGAPLPLRPRRLGPPVGSARPDAAARPRRFELVGIGAAKAGRQGSMLDPARRGLVA